MQTKVTVIPILVHKWRSCDFAHCIFVQYRRRHRRRHHRHGTERKMEILYIIKPPPLIIFILAHRDQADMDFKKKNHFFFSHIGAHVVQLQ